MVLWGPPAHVELSAGHQVLAAHLLKLEIMPAADGLSNSKMSSAGVQVEQPLR